ncbi:hypothetical protein [Ruegeria lacuscaerulensis]|uniref:hypothetical protein n=1 Tax=Ruegeria lacuscaerulensis TaxID=55218 RepID=UPI00147B90A3|nr:hypothetical protein [Ruegeria lacuscaerulensis]
MKVIQLWTNLHRLLLTLGIWATNAMLVSADVVLSNGSEVAPNIAVFHVKDDGVYLDLEIFVDDIPLFAGLLPDSWLIDHALDGPGLEQYQQRSDGQTLAVIAEGEGPLSAAVRTIEPRTRVDRASPLASQFDPFSGKIVPSPPSDPRVLFVELFYPFLRQRPKQITIRPPMKDGIPLATIGMHVLDREVPVTDFSFLSKSANLEMHWPDPWHTRFSAESLNRQAQDAASTFLYIEPREVRHETLIRLRDLAPWIGETVEVGQTLSPLQSARITEKAAAFLALRNPVSIDGDTVQSVRATADMLKLTSQGFQIVEPGRDVSANNAFLGVILSFPSNDLPEQATVTWDMFDAETSRVATISTDLAGPFFGAVTPADPQFRWRNHLLKYERETVSAIPVDRKSQRLPALVWIAGVIGRASLLLMLFGRLRTASGAVMILAALTVIVFSGSLPDMPWKKSDLPEPQTAENVFRLMLENLNTVTLEPTADSRRAELMQIVTSEAQEDIASEVERGLAIRAPGGSIARVTDIGGLTLESLDPTTKPGGFSTLAKWTVRAEAGHWGHAHIRAVAFRALVEIVPEDGHWKLDGLTIIEARDPNA